MRNVTVNYSCPVIVLATSGPSVNVIHWMNKKCEFAVGRRVGKRDANLEWEQEMRIWSGNVRRE